MSDLRAQPCEPTWDNTVGNSGFNSTVWSLAATQEVSAVGPALYAGGQFSTAGGAAAKNIAVWDGNSWSPLGTGAENGGTVHAIAVSDSVVYVGGAFGNMGGIADTKRIAQWDGAAWSDVGGGMSQNNAGIRAFAFFQSDLYTGGFLNEIGGIVAHKLARWDGSVWSSLPGDPLGLTDVVYALTTYDDGGGDALYVGGSFNSAGGDANADNVFKWDGTTLEPLGRGANDEVEALAVFNGELYCGGHFSQVTQTDGTVVAATKIAKWDGNTWSAVDGGLSNGVGFHVWSLAVFDDGTGPALFVGGQFSTAGGTAVLNIAKYDGTAWSEVGTPTPLNGQVRAFAPFDDGTGQALYVGGTFTTNVAQPAGRITAWENPVPAMPSNAAADPAAMCEDDATTLTASAASGIVIDWYTDGCGQTLIDTGPSIMVSPSETTVYYARARDDGNGCESAACASVTVTVRPRGTGDINDDGLRDGRDIQDFIDQTLLPDPSSNAHCAADMNEDQSVTTADLPLFIAALLTP